MSARHSEMTDNARGAVDQTVRRQAEDDMAGVVVRVLCDTTEQA